MRSRDATDYLINCGMNYIGVLREPAFQSELGPRVLVNIKSVMECLAKNVEDLDPRFLELIFNGALGVLLKKQAAFAPGKPGACATAETENAGFTLDDVLTQAQENSEVDSDMEVSPVDITEWCNGLLGMMLIFTNCTTVTIKKAFLDQFERLVMSSIESNIGKVYPVAHLLVSCAGWENYHCLVSRTLCDDLFMI